MKITTISFSAIFILLFLFMLSCATIRLPGEIEKPVAKFYDNFSFDIVWDAAILALQDIGFLIKTIDKESGLLFAETSVTAANRVMWGNLAENRQMNITVRKSEEKILVQVLELLRHERFDEHFFNALDVRLGIKNDKQSD